MASRNLILRGPAMVQYNGADFFSKGDIKLQVITEAFDIMTSEYGKVDSRTKERMAKVSFEPAGEWENLTVLWPYRTTQIGASIFTASDIPLKIFALDGKLIQFGAAAVTKVPSLHLSAVNTAIGEVEFTCITKNDIAWSVANGFYENITAPGFPGTSTFNPVNVLTQPYKGAWGASAPWDNFQTKEGFFVDFNLSVAPLETDTDGMIDYMFEKMDVVARCSPIASFGGTPGAITEQQILDALKLQGAGVYRGQSLQALSNNADLIITNNGGTAVTVTLFKSSVRTANFGFGATTVRAGDIEFVTTRKLTAGVIDPLYQLA